MEKKIQTLIDKIKNFNFPKEKFNLKKINMQGFNSKQIKGTAALICATALVLTGAFTLNYLDTKSENLKPAPGYAISADGLEACVVRDASSLEETIAKIKQDLEDETGLDITIDTKFTVDDVMVSEADVTDESELYDLLKSKVTYSMLAYAIKINSETVGIVETEAEAQSIIDAVVDHFTEGIDKSTILDIKTAENVKFEQIKSDKSKLQDAESIKNYIIKGTNEEQIYTVVEGDTYWDIALEHNMSLDELITANPNSDPTKIQIGDELNLIVPKPFINVQIKREINFQMPIPFETEYEYASYMYTDEESVKKEGVKGVSQVEAIVTEQNGIEIAKELVSQETISEPEAQIVVKGTKDPPPVQGEGIFAKPLSSYIVSSRFGPRSGGYHYGLDMATSAGTAIRAADGGTVTFAGWQGTYGYMVEIDHGGGYKTRYAHCSQIKVSKGDQVTQGQIVGLVGSTGLATGPHLHFEVRKYGEAVNPASYIGVQYK